MPKNKKTQPILPREEWPYDVPKNWIWTHWGTCGKFVAGSGFPKEYQGRTEYPIPFYKVGSLKNADHNGYLNDISNTIDENIRINLKSALIPKDSIIFAKIGEAIRLNRRRLNPIPCCIDNNMIAYIPCSMCNLWYSYFWSTSIDLYDYTNATTVPAIRKSDLEAIPVPLPPLPEQQRIVARIESLFAKLDAAEMRIKDALEKSERLWASVLHLAFTGELTKKWREDHGVGMESWANKRFDEAASIKCNLVQPSDFPEFPHIAPDNIEKYTGELLNYGTVRDDKVISGKHHFFPGQILYSKIRPYLSKVVIAEFEGLCSADMYPIEAAQNVRYLWYYMLSGKFLFQASNAGSRSVLPKINQKELSRITVPLPTLPEQQEIVRILDTVFGSQKRVKEIAEQNLARIARMKKSLLSLAFRGQLGTNNPAEESMESLLLASS